MIKLLVEAPTGQQEVIEITASGSYFDPDRVLWDERTDGPLPEITLGGMVRERVVTVVHHPAEMGDDGRGEYTQISPAWDEEMVSWGPLTFDQAVLDARPVIPAPAIVVPMHKAREALIRSGVSVAATRGHRCHRGRYRARAGPQRLGILAHGVLAVGACRHPWRRLGPRR